MSYRSNFVRYLGRLPLFLVQGAPWKVMAPANPSWRSPHCCQQETKMALWAIAQFVHYVQWGWSREDRFQYSCSSSYFYWGYKLPWLIFCTIKRQLEKDKKKLQFLSALVYYQSTLGRARQARDRYLPRLAQTSFTCDESRGTAAQHFMGLSFSLCFHTIFSEN